MISIDHTSQYNGTIDSKAAEAAHNGPHSFDLVQARRVLWTTPQRASRIYSP